MTRDEALIAATRKLLEVPVVRAAIPGATPSEDFAIERALDEIPAGLRDALIRIGAQAERNRIVALLDTPEAARRVSRASGRYADGSTATAGSARWLIYDTIAGAFVAGEIFDNRAERDARIVEFNARAACSALVAMITGQGGGDGHV